MDRRSFFKYSAGAMVGVSLLGRATSAFARDESSYSAVILGDTHYDAPDPEKYHAGYTDPNPTREASPGRNSSATPTCGIPAALPW